MIISQGEGLKFIEAFVDLTKEMKVLKIKIGLLIKTNLMKLVEDF
jgi:hypothetical protein